MWPTSIGLLLLLSCLCVCEAHPSYLPPVEAVEYTPTIIGHSLHTVPTAVSHQSSTIVHDLRPVYRHTPVVQSYAPIVQSYTPVLHSYAPISSLPSHDWPINSYAPLSYSSHYGWPQGLDDYLQGRWWARS